MKGVNKEMELIGLTFLVLATFAFALTWRTAAYIHEELERIYAEINNIREEFRAFYSKSKQDGDER